MRNKLASFENDIDFRRLWRIGAVISAVAMVVCLGALLVRNLNLGIDFEGGTSWEVPQADVSVSDARDALSGTEASNAKIQTVGEDTLRVQADPSDEAAIVEVAEALSELTGVDENQIGISTVGPTWGDEISEKALRALVFFFIIIAGYISLRLEWKMAAGALVAVVHDIIITIGFYALLQLEVTPATVIAVLTILGYSLYDTIVVFDKVQDNVAKPAVAQKLAYTDLMSLSLNQVLMRSLNTSITSLLPVLAMLFVGSYLLGAVTLQEFGVALAVGLVTGAYSSIFVSAPLVAYLKEREPYYRNLRKRLEHRGPARASTGTVSGEAGVATAATSASAPGAPELSGRVIPPRPRKKGKRR